MLTRPTTAAVAACFTALLAAAPTALADPLRPAETPARTRARLQHAIDHAAPGDTITLTEGTYELDAPLRIPGRIELRAADGADVVLSGGRRMQLDWVPDPTQPGVYRADLPADLGLDALAFDALFHNDQRLHPARYPNHDPTQRYFGGTAADALSPERIATWTDPAGGFIHSLHRAEWGGNHWHIRGKRDDGTLDLEGGWMNNRPSGINPTHRFVENIREELDAPGEWFLDRAARVLYLIPPDGFDPAGLNDATLVASGIDRLIEVIGASPDDPAGGLTLTGVTLAHTARTFMRTDEPLLRSDWMIHRGGAVYVENATDITIQDCTLTALGGNGVFVSGYASNVQIRGCHLYDIGASGVCFVGRPEAVRSPAFRYEQSVPLDEIDRTPGPKTEDYPRDCVVEDCLVHDLGTVEKQVAGVQIAMASRITARHLSIYDVPRAGINIGDGCWGGHLIEWCDVFDTVRMTGDHGSFNSWGRDRFWHPNRATLDEITTDHPELILLDAVETTTIRNSRWRCDHGWDIDLDDGSSNYDIYNNLCLAGGLKLREGFHRTVRNNVIVNNSLHPHVWFAESHDVFERNIVGTWYRPIRLQGWGDRIDHNLLPSGDALSRSRGLGLDAHSVAGDPGFLDPEAGDFRVADGSPALALGFENFPMDRFGVRKPTLRAIARTPTIPTPSATAADSTARERVFLGATVRQLRGLGERSAAGLDAERGVLVLAAPAGSVAHTAGLRADDVILRVGGHTAVNQPSELQPAYLRGAAGEPVAVTVFRNQAEQTLAVPGVAVIRLTAEDARPVVAADAMSPVYDPDKDYLGRWTDADATLAWGFMLQGQGEFDVYVELAGTADAAGAAWAFTVADQTLTGTTPDTGGWETFQRVHLGTIRLAHNGNLQAALRPTGVPGAAVMNLRAVELIRR